MTRSVVAVAVLGIGSAALTAVPATAATANGITRDQVLTAAAGVRAAPAGTPGTPFGSLYNPATNRALRAMANRACAIDPDGPELSYGTLAAATASGSGAEGVVVTALLLDTDSLAPGGGGVPNGRICSFGALAAVDGRGVLSGTATLTGLPAATLSGDVFVTSTLNGGISALFGGDGSALLDSLPTFSASGASTVTVQTKVAIKKTTQQKKAAKAKYTKQLKSAKKAYKKAIDKAGSKASKKKAAKKAYAKKRSAAKATYTKAIATSKLVPSSTSTPFSVSAKFVVPAS